MLHRSDWAAAKIGCAENRPLLGLASHKVNWVPLNNFQVCQKGCRLQVGWTRQHEKISECWVLRQQPDESISRINLMDNRSQASFRHFPDGITLAQCGQLHLAILLHQFLQGNELHGHWHTTICSRNPPNHYNCNIQALVTLIYREASQICIPLHLYTKQDASSRSEVMLE